MKKTSNQSCWDILQISSTSSEKEIKKAYAKLIKEIDTQNEITEFQSIRKAFDDARNKVNKKNGVNKSEATFLFEEINIELTDFLLEDYEIGNGTINRHDDLYSIDSSYNENQMIELDDELLFNNFLPNLLFNNSSIEMVDILNIISLYPTKELEYLQKILEYIKSNSLFIRDESIQLVCRYIEDNVDKVNENNINEYKNIIIEYQHLLEDIRLNHFEMFNDNIDELKKCYQLIYQLIKQQITYKRRKDKNNLILEEKLRACGVSQNKIETFKIAVLYNNQNYTNLRKNLKILKELEQILFDNPNNIDAQLMFLSIVFILKYQVKINDDASFIVKRNGEEKLIIVNLDSLKDSFLPKTIYGIPLIYLYLGKKEEALKKWEQLCGYKFNDERIIKFIVAEFPESFVAKQEIKKRSNNKILYLVVYFILIMFFVFRIILSAV